MAKGQTKVSLNGTHVVTTAYPGIEIVVDGISYGYSSGDTMDISTADKNTSAVCAYSSGVITIDTSTLLCGI